jgi:prepilin-type N-terminal cleavage/methylation domain-containing protein
MSNRLPLAARPASPTPHGYTLVELLVVITIIGKLISLLLPAVQAAREAARQMQCQNNLRQVALACHNFESAKRGLPLLYSSSNQLGWVTQVLPYFEQGNLCEQFNVKEPWFDTSNVAAVTRRIALLECPSSPAAHLYTATNPGFAGQSSHPLTTFTVASTDYFAIAGASSSTSLKAPSTTAPGYFAAYPNASSTTDLSGALGPQSTTPTSRRLADVKDGLSNTVMISEMSGRPWLYLAAAQRIAAASFPSYVSASSADVADDVPLNYGWGGWPHNNNFNVGTWSSDGAMQGGTGAVNCSNYRGVYSFHAAGAYGAFADGSVHLLRRELSPAVFFALVTARAGEMVPAY